MCGSYLNLCYGNIPDGYKSVSYPPLGTSDHNTIHLIPAYYTPKIQTEQVVKKNVKVSSCNSVQQLQGCFDCTDWDLFLDSFDNIHDATDVISDSTTFCEDIIIPKKTVEVYPDNKPWVSKYWKNNSQRKEDCFPG